SETGGLRRGILPQTLIYHHFRVESGRSKGLPKGNRWTNGDMRPDGHERCPQADLSTESCFGVDLSPGREASLWITSVDNENLQVGPGRTARLEAAVLAARDPVRRRDELLVRCPLSWCAHVLDADVRARVRAEEAHFQADPFES